MYLYSTKTISQYPIISKWCKRTTAVNTGYKYKLVRLVPTDKAKRLDFYDVKWHNYKNTIADPDKSSTFVSVTVLIQTSI